MKPMKIMSNNFLKVSSKQKNRIPVKNSWKTKILTSSLTLKILISEKKDKVNVWFERRVSNIKTILLRAQLITLNNLRTIKIVMTLKTTYLMMMCKI